MTTIRIDHILVRADPGVALWVALREAAEMAFRENRDVLLCFNDREYTIDVAAILEYVQTEFEAQSSGE